ncbi:hypothetical protein WDU94_005674 [Cyamophila willieti]
MQDLCVKINQEVASIKTEVKNIQTEVKTSIKTEVKNQIVPYLRKVNTLEKRVNQHDGKIDILDTRLEQEKRKRNIILYNIPLLENETIQVLENKVLNIFSDMGVQSTTQDIDYIKRLHRNKPGSNPVLVTFALLKKKLEVLSKRSNLKQTQYYLNEDFSDEMRKKRKELFPVVKRMREEGKFALMKFDEIFTKNSNGRLVKVDLPIKSDNHVTQPSTSMGTSTPVIKRKGGKKRTFPISPVDVHMSGSEGEVHMDTPNPKRIADEEYEESEEYSDAELNDTIMQDQTDPNTTVHNSNTGSSHVQLALSSTTGPTPNSMNPNVITATPTQD